MTNDAFWKKHSYVVFENFWTIDEQQALERAASEIFAWPETSGKWLKYFEDNAQHNSMLCRVERFLPYHPQLKQMLLSKRIFDVLRDLFGEDACLFKDKINYKLPGGGAFKPHQDAPAFTMFAPNYHITMMVPLDTLTPTNGPVEFARSYAYSQHTRLVLESKADGTLADHEVSSRTWDALYLKPGDLVFFDSYIPHRSAVNTSDKARRSFYITFNPQSQGDIYDTYFERKRKYFPPRVENVDRDADFDPEMAKRFNLGNPIR